MIIHKNIAYQHDDKTFEGVLVYSSDIQQKVPGLVMAPNWLGITAGAINLANQQAECGYIVLIVDLYGKDIRPKNAQQAGEAMQPLKKDRIELRAKMATALAVLKEQANCLPLDVDNVAAFGFCFGGCCALELARSGANIKAAISFHGNLDTPNLKDAKNIKAAILVLDGANDPLVPREQLPVFINEMSAFGVDWQMISYGGVAHGFTDLAANEPGVKQYNAKVTKRAFNAMNQLLNEVFVLAK